MRPAVLMSLVLVGLTALPGSAQTLDVPSSPEPEVSLPVTPDSETGLAGYDLTVSGLRRVSTAAFLNSLSGVSENEDGDIVATGAFSIPDSIRALYETRLFRDIEVYTDRDARRVRFVVTEFPTIDRVTVNGNERIPDQAIDQALESLDVVEGQSYRASVLSVIRRELESQYALQGRYNARVDVSVDPLPQNRVAVVIDIQEGQAAAIRSIELRGNETFPADEILADTQLRPRRTGDPLQLFRRRYEYNRQAYAGDLETINSFYLDRGYVRFGLENSHVSLEPDLTGVHLLTEINEGRRYRWGAVSVSGQFAGFEEEIRAAVRPVEDTWFNRSELVDTQDEILTILGNDGYLFAEAEPRVTIDDEALTVDLQLVVRPGPQVTVRTISFTGNQGTLDEVLRREMRVVEGGLARRDDIAASRRRLQQLGFFSQVQVDQQRVGGSADQIDLEFSVVEDESGNIQASLGFQPGVGIFSAIEFSQENFLGTGKSISLSSQFGQDSSRFNLEHTDPYFTQGGISRDLTAFYERTNWLDRSVATYGIDRWGGEFALGAPLTDNSRLSLGIGYTQNDLYLGSYPPDQVTSFASANGNSYGDWTSELAWSYNDQIGSFYATEGQRHRVALSLTLPGSDLSYYRLTYQGSRVWPTGLDGFAFRWLGQAGYGSGYGDDDTLPFYRNFYAGGPGTVRGFREQSVSPLGEYEDTPPITPRPIGGNSLLSTGAELLIPTPIARDQSVFRTALFADTGLAFDANGGVPLDRFRASVGVDVVWRPIPLLPLRFIYARPVLEQPGDDVETFKFTFWSNF